MSGATLHSFREAQPPPDPFAVAADLIDPPKWEVRDRDPLKPHQSPPDERFSLWILEGGRGAGKTEGGSRYFAKYMRTHPGHRGRIIAPTFGDAVESCIEGPSGLKSIDPEINFLASAPGGAKVVWPNGAEALVLGTHSPRDVERLRAGGNRHIDWWEEMAANPQLGPAWDQAQFGLRLGDNPHSIATSTPRGTAAYRKIRGGDGVVLTHGTMDDNDHLSDEWKAQQRARYEGTRLGRQELGGELLEDVEGALWDRTTFDDHRVDEHPDLSVVVVAIDPAVTSSATADDTGIIVAGLGTDGHAYVLADETCHLGPKAWATVAVTAHETHKGDRIVAEVNNGGDLVEEMIRTVDESVPYKAVHASRGKETRAQPVSALYEQGRVHHVGSLAKLEDQCCSWVPGEEKSPDRLDALVWAITDLLLRAGKPTPDIGPVSVSGRSSFRS